MYSSLFRTKMSVREMESRKTGGEQAAPFTLEKEVNVNVCSCKQNRF
jgi:hypothetical protein